MSTGEGFNYYSRGTSLGDRESVGDWQGIDLVRQADVNRDYYQDYVYRNSAGELYWWGYDRPPRHTRTNKIGARAGAVSANIHAHLATLTGDGLVDLTGERLRGHAVELWAGRGTRHLRSPRSGSASGWSTFQVRGRGDFSGDGKPDLLARDRRRGASGCTRARAPRPPRSPRGSRWPLAAAWPALPPRGDVTGDGRADFIVRDAAGELWAYVKGPPRVGDGAVPDRRAGPARRGLGQSIGLLGEAETFSGRTGPHPQGSGAGPLCVRTSRERDLAHSGRPGARRH